MAADVIDARLATPASRGRRRGGSNASYWGPKIARNQERDAEQAARLDRNGWTVVRIWEHEDTTLAVERISELVSRSTDLR